ncbi:MAG: STAS domain-containing protein [Patescibacteria group bacterium]
MDIDLYSSGPVTFIDLDGEMNADNCTEVRDMVMDSLAVHKFFVINVKNVPYMDSTSIGTLMSLVQEVQLMDGELKLVGPLPSLRRILGLVNTERVFDIYEKTEEAIRAIGLDPKEFAHLVL